MIPIEKNPFRVLYVDLTHRCNERCKNCYDWKNKGDTTDLSIEYWEEVCKRLPDRTMFRMLGGEPTLHPQFFDFLDVAHKYGHITTVSSNGVKFRDEDFVKEMVKYKTIFNLSMDGGLTRDDVYERFVGRENMTNEKREALELLTKHNPKNLSISAIIMRGYNEDIVGGLLDVQKEYPVVNWIKYRSIGHVGSYIDSKPYDTTEFMELFGRFLTHGEIHDNPVYFSKLSHQKCRNCCYHFTIPKRNVFVSFVEFASPNSTKCWRRGKLIENEFYVTPFFAHMVKNMGQHIIDEGENNE
jgi:MoaA/NifB/PqqE/SkfB family radical SAM enzyme